MAGALETDAEFRSAYEDLVLTPPASDGVVPRIAGVEVQALFTDQRSCPDMLLMLEDGPGARGAGGVRGGLSRPSSFMNLMSLGHAAGAGGCQLLAQEAS